MSAGANRKIAAGFIMAIMMVQCGAWSLPLGSVCEPAPVDRAGAYQRAWDRFKVGARGYGIWIQCETMLYAEISRAGCFMAFGDNLYSLSFVEGDTLGIIVGKNYTADGRTIVRKERVASADEFMKRFEPLAYWTERMFIVS